jgi:hypothetical protein
MAFDPQPGFQRGERRMTVRECLHSEQDPEQENDGDDPE